MRTFPTYLRGGALLLAILLATMIGVVTGGLLLLLQHHRLYSAKNLRDERLRQNLSSATNLLLLGNGSSAGNTLRLFGEERDSIMILRKPWGIFEIGIVHAFERSAALTHAFIMGRTLEQDERYALYLADEQRPLSISGETRIQGDAYLPEAGIRKSYIENQAYAFDQVVHGGRQLSSNSRLPALDDTIIHQLAAYLYEDTGDPITTDSTYHQFSLPPRVLHSPDSVTIGKVPLAGNVILTAQSSITVLPDANVDGILLFAPVIRFAEGYRGRIQAFATDSLVVDGNCRFEYPSALGLVNIPKDSTVYEFQPTIRLGNGTVVYGIVFTHFPGPDELLAHIRVDKQAIVNGQVYADGLLELQGTVNGITLCRRFSLQTPSSLYENFVLGGTMDYTGLPKHYAGSPILNRGRIGNILKWLDTEP